MYRRRRDEIVERLRLDRLDEFIPLARRCARWALDNVARLRGADPPVPAELHDRAADNWRPLLAIADLAGGDWPEKKTRPAACPDRVTGGDRRPGTAVPGPPRRNGPQGEKGPSKPVDGCRDRRFPPERRRACPPCDGALREGARGPSRAYRPAARCARSPASMSFSINPRKHSAPARPATAARALLGLQFGYSSVCRNASTRPTAARCSRRHLAVRSRLAPRRLFKIP
jgi:hypothetical protein